MATWSFCIATTGMTLQTLPCSTQPRETAYLCWKGRTVLATMSGMPEAFRLKTQTGDFHCIPEPIPDALATELRYRVPIACL